jgi:hypothetical protein
LLPAPTVDAAGLMLNVGTPSAKADNEKIEAKTTPAITKPTLNQFMFFSLCAG